jgi:hypothetical protein
MSIASDIDRGACPFIRFGHKSPGVFSFASLMPRRGLGAFPTE